jgi:MFS family permease
MLSAKGLLIMRSKLAGAVVSLIGAILQATSKTIAQIIVARIVTGLGVGIMTANVPIVSRHPSLEINWTTSLFYSGNQRYLSPPIEASFSPSKAPT